ncbi:hypothetical protein Q1695_008426 [Nippostrongylus brasiliensis]|nr:hypothetical protein Q1695_008426 [Nippostrongylus brasiliensis]
MSFSAFRLCACWGGKFKVSLDKEREVLKATARARASKAVAERKRVEAKALASAVFPQGCLTQRADSEAVSQTRATEDVLLEEAGLSAKRLKITDSCRPSSHSVNASSSVAPPATQTVAQVQTIPDLDSACRSVVRDFQ